MAEKREDELFSMGSFWQLLGFVSCLRASLSYLLVSLYIKHINSPRGLQVQLRTLKPAKNVSLVGK